MITRVCGINSDYGWASLLCNQTNWLPWGVCDWTDSSYDVPCAGFYPPVNQEQKNEKQELSVTGGRTQALGVLRPSQSRLGRGHTDDHRLDPPAAPAPGAQRPALSCVGCWRRARPPRTPPSAGSRRGDRAAAAAPQPRSESPRQMLNAPPPPRHRPSAEGGRQRLSCIKLSTCFGKNSQLNLSSSSCRYSSHYSGWWH